MPVFMLGLFRSVVRGLRTFRVRPLRLQDHSERNGFQLRRRRPLLQQFSFKLREILVWGSSNPSNESVTLDPGRRLTFPDPGWHAIQFYNLRRTRKLNRHWVCMTNSAPARARRQGSLVLAIVQGSANL